MSWSLSHRLAPRSFCCSGMALLAGSLVLPAWAQVGVTSHFDVPGLHAFVVPPEATVLRVTIKGASGGAGGWDDGPGGDGAGGSIVTATITVQGGETVSLVVGEGGEGALAPPKIALRPRGPFGNGGAGGGSGDSQEAGAVTSPLPGAGGRGGDQGSKGGSPGGGGGGGASSLRVGGAAIVAGGGGGGGANSLVRPWNQKAPNAENAGVLNEQDADCGTMAAGGRGGDGDDDGPADGGGGGGGGGGYLNHAGAGGKAALDRIRHGAPGISGESCTLGAGRYRVTVTESVGFGAPTPPVPDRKVVVQPSGEPGAISILPLAIAVPMPKPTPTPVPALGALGLLLTSAGLAGAGVWSVRRRGRRPGSKP